MAAKELLLETTYRCCYNKIRELWLDAPIPEVLLLLWMTLNVGVVDHVEKHSISISVDISNEFRL